MLSKEEIIAKAVECGFEDTGFTTAEPFDSQRALLEGMREEYGWAIQSGLDLIAGTDPKTVLPGAKSIIVLVEAYFREAFRREGDERVKAMGPPGPRAHRRRGGEAGPCGLPPGERRPCPGGSDRGAGGVIAGSVSGMRGLKKLILDIGGRKVYTGRAFRFGFGCLPSPEPAIKASGFFCA